MSIDDAIPVALMGDMRYNQDQKSVVAKDINGNTYEFDHVAVLDMLNALLDGIGVNRTIYDNLHFAVLDAVEAYTPMTCTDTAMAHLDDAMVDAIADIAANRQSGRDYLTAALDRAIDERNQAYNAMYDKEAEIRRIEALLDGRGAA